MGYYEKQHIKHTELVECWVWAAGVTAVGLIAWLAYKYLPGWLVATAAIVVVVALLLCWVLALCATAKRADQASHDIWMDHWQN